MSDATFVDRMNREHFAGGLSPAFLRGLRDLPTERDDVKAFIVRMFRFMDQAEMTARDLSVLQGDILGSLLARILPGAWQGRVPPITVKGRHQRIDELILNSRYLGPRETGSMLDLGCGFPPETTLDSAERLKGWTIHGADPSMPAFMVHDTDGAYATFNDRGEMIYCQPSAPSVENWNELLADPDATTRRFREIQDRFGEAHSGVNEHPDGSRLTIDPKRTYERPGLTFSVGGIGQVDKSGFDVVRCFNVMYYFNDDFRQKALEWFASILNPGGVLIIGGDWAFTTECRYFVYQHDGDAMPAREFAFSLDNVLPLGLVPFFALHEKDRGLTLLARLVRTLRRDEAFRGRYYDLVDSLREEHGACPRDEDGFYGDVPQGIDPGELWGRAATMSDAISSELGGEAVEILQRAGWESWINEIGIVSVSLESIPEDAG
jgi:SAM-dependent methyltransferase